MSHLYVPTAMEAHLIAVHGVDPRLISALHEIEPKLAAQVARLSHGWIHMADTADSECTSSL